MRRADSVQETGSLASAQFSGYSLFDEVGALLVDEELLLSDEVAAGFSEEPLPADLLSPSAEAFIEPAFGFAA
ncbi:MAG: hypothetical protein WA476_01625 [Acidobacteriaceae bacterium]